MAGVFRVPLEELLPETEAATTNLTESLSQLSQQLASFHSQASETGDDQGTHPGSQATE